MALYPMPWGEIEWRKNVNNNKWLVGLHVDLDEENFSLLKTDCADVTEAGDIAQTIYGGQKPTSVYVTGVDSLWEVIAAYSCAAFESSKKLADKTRMEDYAEIVKEKLEE